MFNFLHGQMLKSFWVPLCSGSGGGGSGCHHSRDDCQEDGVTLPELLALWGKWRPSSTAEGTGQPRLVLATDSVFFFYWSSVLFHFSDRFSELSREAVEIWRAGSHAGRCRHLTLHVCAGSADAFHKLLCLRLLLTASQLPCCLC